MRERKIERLEQDLTAAQLEEGIWISAINDFALHGDPGDSEEIQYRDSKLKIARDRIHSLNEQIHAMRGPVWKHHWYGWVQSSDDPQDPAMRQVPAPVCRPAPVRRPVKALAQVRRAPRARAHRAGAARPTAKTATAPPGTGDPDSDPGEPQDLIQAIDKMSQPALAGKGAAHAA